MRTPRTDGDAEAGAPREPETAALPRVARGGDLPVTPTQKSYWAPGGTDPRLATLLNLVVARRLEGPLDGSALQRAFDAIVERHESLRTCFPSIDGAPVQRIGPAAPALLRSVDLSLLAYELRAAALERCLRDEITAPFDLEHGPIYRVLLVRCGPTEHVLSFVMHHVGCDGWSMGIVLRNLRSLYSAFASGREPRPIELPVQPADYAAWYRRSASADALERERQFWRDHLRGAATSVPLPFDRAPEPGRAARSETVTVALGAVLHRALGRGDRGAFTLLGGAYVATLWLLSRQSDLVLGTVHANRDRPEILDVIGSFAQIVPIRTRVEGGDTLAQIAERFEEDSGLTFRHLLLPMDAIIAAASTAPRGWCNPLYNVSFNLHPRRRAFTLQGRGGVVTATPLRTTLASPAARVDLVVAAYPLEDETDVSWTFDAERFSRSTIEAIARRHVRVLEHMIRTPAMRLDEL